MVYISTPLIVKCKCVYICTCIILYNHYFIQLKYIKTILSLNTLKMEDSLSSSSGHWPRAGRNQL